MKFTTAVAALAATLVTVVESSPVPSDPLNLDLCGLLGTDLDLTPQQTLEGEFTIQVQNKDLTGAKKYLSRKPYKKGSPYSTYLWPVDASKIGQAISFTLKDSVLTEVSGTNVNMPAYIAGATTPVGATPLGAYFEDQRGPFVGKTPFQARHVCDPVTKEATMVLEVQPGYNPVERESAGSPYYESYQNGVAFGYDPKNAMFPVVTLQGKNSDLANVVLRVAPQ